MARKQKPFMIEEFRKRYDSVDGLRVYRAPGRVNLIGEHTDYNLGFVCPVALDLATYMGTAPNPDGKLRIYSEHLRELGEWDVDELPRITRTGHWVDYPIGVAQQLLQAGYAIEPANLMIRSTVPEGAGLSSSAALEVSTALACLDGRKIDPLELAKLCQRAEREFVGMPCGIMDQYISIFGREHSAVAIDCRSLENRTVKLPDGITFVAVNSMVKHALAGSAYRERVQECAAAVEQIRQRFPEVASLRDVTPAQFAEVEQDLPDLVRCRARHVVMEDERVNRFVDACERNDLALMGRLLVESHRSLQRDYEVSCAELDFLVDTALRIPGVMGSRMTGGGFGGCTVTMLAPHDLPRFREEITRAYEARFQVTPQSYVCNPAEGAGEVRDWRQIPA
jgi:galactokinase